MVQLDTSDRHAALPEALTRVESLPSLPAVALEVLRLAEDENAEFEAYAATLARDPALATKLLRLANSSLFGQPREVTSLAEATALLGLRTVQLMALGFSLVGALPRSGGAPSFRHDAFWRRSLLFAVAARELAQRVDADLADEAFLCGLLSHLGQLVLAHALPDAYEDVVGRCEDWPEAATERAVLGYDHRRVADHVLRTWGIPDVIRIPVVHGHDGADVPGDAGPRAVALARLAAVASQMVRVVCDADKGSALAAVHRAGETLDLERQELDTLLLVLEHRAFEATAMLEVEIPEGESHWAILCRARHQMMELAIGTATDLERSERRSRQLEHEVRRLTHELARDGLTGLGNRQHFDEVLEAEVRSRLRRDVPGALGLLVLDVDRFKGLNDGFGHPVGDEVLRVVAHAISGTSRATDVPVRIGGDEFGILVPHTEPAGLALFAERLRRFVGDLSIPVHGRVHTVTVSVGGATLARAETPADGKRLLEAADRELYRAKNAGRDRVSVATTSLDAADRGTGEG